MSESIKNNLNEIYAKIREAEKKAGRPEGSVKLLAVSKFHPVESVFEALEAGQLFFGENRVQEAASKFPQVFEKNPDCQLHIIGQLQTNKVKKTVEIATTIESVDRLDLVKEIEKQAAKIDKKIRIFLEIHTGEESKSGYSSEEVLIETLDYIAAGNAPHVEPAGFMTMAPLTEDESLIRKSFSSLRQLSEKMQNKYPSFKLTELSMGMSGDFETAIQEGSTEVRVGTAIFGHRNY